MKDKAAEQLASLKSNTAQTQSRVRNRGITYISCQLPGLLVATVKDLLVVVHPDLRESYLVAGNHLCTFGKGVGALCAENVANDRAGDDLQLSAALPHLQVNGRQPKQVTCDEVHCT